MNFISLFTCLFCMITLITAGPSKILIAVDDLRPVNLPNETSLLISERLRTEFIKKPIFRVMERSEMKRVLAEQEFSISGACDDASCAVKIGELLSVRQIIIGTVGLMENNFYAFTIRLVDVESGELTHTASRDGKYTLEEIFRMVLPDLARELESEVLKESYGAIQVKTRPKGAMFSLNGKPEGATPFTQGKMLPGDYFLSLKLNGYADIDTSFSLNVGQTFTLDVSLERSSGYKLKRKLIRSGLIGAAALAFASAGLYMEGVAGDKLDKQERSFAKYNKANTEHDKLYNKYLDARDETVKATRSRNILYGVAGVIGLGCVVSFAF